MVKHISSEASMNVIYNLPLRKERTNSELDSLKKELIMNDHLITLGELCIRYDTNITTGLSKVRAGELLSTYGPNCLVASQGKSTWDIFKGNFFEGFSLLLLIGSVLCFGGYILQYTQDPSSNLDNIWLGIVLLTVVLLTGTFSFIQESSNVAIMESFKKMVPKTATVMRDGEVLVIPSEEVVVGDIVLVTAGQTVPADIRIFQCKNMKVDNSSLTGESEPQARSPQNTEDNPLEATNLAFFSTNIVEGEGKGLVIACGDNTVIGRIAGLTSGLGKETTPLKREMNRFLKMITAIAIALGLIFFVAALIMGQQFIQCIVFFIGIVVANVPEGLAITMTACLTLTATKMSSKNCLVKSLEAIETLGSTTVICSDKTGTLTENRMSVSHVYCNIVIHDCIHGNVLTLTSSDPDFEALARVGALCSRAMFKPDSVDPAIKREVIGDASEAGILKFIETTWGSVSKLRKTYPKVCEIPFNSVNKYQASVHLHDDYHLVVMKGAPERIIDRCSTISIEGQVQSLTPMLRNTVNKACMDLGYQGERVLAFCDRELPKLEFPQDYQFDSENPNFPLDGMRFVGLMSMIDPPRETVPQSVAKCRSAGIRVIMVTGDHPVTATAIARMVGIISASNITKYDLAMRKNTSVSELTSEDQEACNAVVLTGSELRELPSERLHNIIKMHHEIVFARTSPQQKLQIVEAFQHLGNIVAVTGDGVNDSPALKKADIGIAMGITGSDVSKDAADMILLDDNFSSIITGIEEGRLIFDNLKKSIFYTLTSNTPEILPFITYVAFGLPMPLATIAIFVIDVGTDLWPAISLAYEKGESDIMKRLPRNPANDKLVNGRLIALTYLQIGVIQALAGFTGYFLMMGLHGFAPNSLVGKRYDWESAKTLEDSYGQDWSQEERMELLMYAQTAYFVAVVVTQWFDLLICKTRRLSLIHQGMGNHVLNMGLFVETGITVFVCYTPGVNKSLRMRPVTWQFWLTGVPFGMIILIADEVRKYGIRRYPGGLLEQETYY